MDTFVGAAVIDDPFHSRSEQTEPEGYTIDPRTGRARSTGVVQGHRSYASWCHFGPTIAAASVMVTDGITFIVPPLVALALWQIKNRDSHFIDDHGKESLNFQISLIVLAIALVPIAILTCGMGAILYLGLPFLAIAGGIVGGIRASKGDYFRYPMCWRFIH